MHSRASFTPPRRILASICGPPKGITVAHSSRPEAVPDPTTKPSLPNIRLWPTSVEGEELTPVGGGTATAIATPTVPTLRLRSWDEMPAVGLGTWKIPKEATADAVLDSIKAGYRHLDCACDCAERASPRPPACRPSLAPFPATLSPVACRCLIPCFAPSFAPSQTATRRKWATAFAAPSPRVW